MKKYLCYLPVLWLCGWASLSAQAATPARPVDPDAPQPARPVSIPDSLTPNMTVPLPVVPAESTDTSTTKTTTTTVTPTRDQNAVAVLADSSLKLVLQELAQAWADNQDTGPQVPITLTNAGTLRTKAETDGWDVVISADVDDMKELTSRNLVLADGQRTVARNTVVMFGRKALVKDDELEWFDLIGTEWKKIALGNPDLVASGRVAKRALQKHGLIDEDIKGLYTFAVTESQALGVAQREQADAVFVYKTDLVKAKLRGFEVYPISTTDAPPVFYIAAVSRASRNPAQAHSFVDFCGSEPAKAIWAKYGFETN